MHWRKSGSRVCAAALLAWLAFIACGARAQDTRDPNEHFFQAFLGDLEAELATARETGKTGIVLVYEQDECPFCERLHDHIVNRVEVQDVYRKHFLIYKIDIKGDAAISGFDGKDTTEKAFAFTNRVRGTPTTVFYDLQGKELARFTGAPKDVREYLMLAAYVVEGHYKSMPFARYKQQPAR